MSAARFEWGVLGTLVVGSVLALGGVHPQVLGLLAFLGTVLFALGMKDDDGGGVWDFPTVVLLGMCLVVGFQLLPLPSKLVSWISPGTYRLQMATRSATGGEAPMAMPLSIDVSLTVRELVKLLVYLSVYQSARRLAIRSGRSALLKLVVASTSVAAFVFLAHRIMLLKTVYGFYEPRHGHYLPSLLCAPLINPNHMAAYLGVGTTLLIGMAVGAMPKRRRIEYAALGVITGAALVITLSRGGMAAFVAAQLFFVTILLIRRRLTGERRASGLGWVLVVVFVALGLGIFAAQDAVLGEFVNGEHQKIEMPMEALPLIKQFPLFGVGRGAFQVGFPLVSTWSATRLFTHAENVVVQLLVDFGVVFGSAVLLSGLWYLLRRLRRLPRKPRAVATLCALLGLTIHNLVDFNIEIPAVAILVMVLLAVLSAPRKGENASDKRPLPRFFSTVLMVGCLVGAGVALGWLPTATPEAEGMLAKQALDNADRSYFDNAHLEQVLFRHPASAYLPFIAGVERFENGEIGALALLGLAVARDPQFPAAHLYIGRQLLTQGHLRQAMLEFRLATTYDERFARHAVRFLLHYTKNVDLLLQVAPPGRVQQLMYNELARQLSAAGDIDKAEQMDLALLRHQPHFVDALVRQSRRLAKRGQVADAVLLAQTLPVENNGGLARTALIAMVYDLAGAHQKALDVLKKKDHGQVHDEDFLTQMAFIAAKAGDGETALNAADRLRRVASEVSAHGRAVAVRGDVLTLLGRRHEALSAFRQACAIYPENNVFWQKRLQAARRVGQTDEERRVLVHLSRVFPDGPYSAALQTLENRLKNLENRTIK